MCRDINNSLIILLVSCVSMVGLLSADDCYVLVGSDDSIANGSEDNPFQTIGNCINFLGEPDDYDVIATMNLNGDYISDALAAQVGGIGISPGANINFITGKAIFEATHGTAPKYTGLDKVNPGSLILSGEMMLRYLGWDEAADLIIKGMNKTIAKKTVTYDFARLMNNAKEVKCSEFADELIKNMDLN